MSFLVLVLELKRLLTARVPEYSQRLIRYYHVAAGFPTKPTWLAEIKNGTIDREQALTKRLSPNTFLNPRKCGEATGAKSSQG